ncbi:hypothetical protein B0T10DRAFT_527473 [Thelonectria olida]|uniref:TauD/TfdA-like domain-containing protein n=1 Tax=Thelonectria olida TaxID=1576542 RepID=A0A9P9ARF2_9HYPO|nr:hypothetical protein B0T10DRAFT_527473 [Thelonectria olida]
MAEFKAFDVPNARVYHGNALPYGLEVKSSLSNRAKVSTLDAIAALRAMSESGEVQRLLDRHGAVLIRGIGDPSAQTFSDLVFAAEEPRGTYPYVQIGLAGKRTPVAKNVWTANEGSPLTRFYQHNEKRKLIRTGDNYSRYTRFPTNIHFYCVKKAPKGGATPIAHSANVYEKVLVEIPELVNEVKKRGLGMKMIFRAPGKEGKQNQFNWAGEHSFGQEFQLGDDLETRKIKVEKQVRRLTDDFRWLGDDALELTQHIPGLRRVPGSQKPVWFNGLVGRHGITRDIGALEPPHIGRDGMTYLPCVYGDGTPIPRAYLDKLIDVIDKEEIFLTLEEGDMLLVDNFQVSHGREPWEGERQILVSMWDGAAPIAAY